MLCVVPLLRALRTAFPSAKIVLMTSLVNHEVMRGNRYLDDVMLYDKRELLSRWGLRISAIRTFVKDLQERRFDMTIVPATVSMSFTSDLLALLSGAPVRIGAASLNGRENPSAYVYTRAVELDWRECEDRHQTLRNFDCARDLGMPAPELFSEMTLSPMEQEEGRRFAEPLRTGKECLVVAIHPGAGKVPNRWPADRFAAVARTLGKRHETALLVTAGPMDDDPLEYLRNCLDVPCYVIQNQPIRRVASILANADLLISNDTGIMHVGAAVGTPVVSLFGPTDPRQWAPVGARHRWLRGDEGDITNISVDAVLNAAEEVLSMVSKNGGRYDEAS